MIKIYQLDKQLKRKYFKINEIKEGKTLNEIVKIIAKNKTRFNYNRLLKSYDIYVENIPKKISKDSDLTITIDTENHEIRYFNSLCN